MDYDYEYSLEAPGWQLLEQIGPWVMLGEENGEIVEVGIEDFEPDCVSEAPEDWLIPDMPSMLEEFGLLQSAANDYMSCSFYDPNLCPEHAASIAVLPGQIQMALQMRKASYNAPH